MDMGRPGSYYHLVLGAKLRQTQRPECKLNLRETEQYKLIRDESIHIQ